MDGSNRGYRDLEARFRRLSLIGDALGMLRWDAAVIMPSDGSDARAEQVAEIKVLAHEILTDPETGDLLDAAEARATALDDWQAANLRLMRRRWLRASAVPASLVAAKSHAVSSCEMRWRTARPEDDFAAILPLLEDVLDRVQETGQALGAALDLPDYDALMDGYEPGCRTTDIDPLFDDYVAFLPEFLEAVLERQAGEPPPEIPEGPFPEAVQAELCREFATAVGIDFNSARLDPTLHPFSGGTPEDSRITTRYDEADFSHAVMAVLHESGHAMYERNLPANPWRHQPVGDAAGLGLHESQSLIVEMQACRSQAFLEWSAPRLRAAFGGSGPAWEAGNLHRAAIQVERGLIRVDADEVTYPGHVILRYRLERAMIEGVLRPAELPEAWREGMQELLGVAPAGDRDGCLQDIHWYDGAWGYFPTYTICAMAAAQLFAAARMQDAAIEPGISVGDFRPLMQWLAGNVHGEGARFTTSELLERVTGRGLDPEAFKTHLRQRYLSGG